MLGQENLDPLQETRYQMQHRYSGNAG